MKRYAMIAVSFCLSLVATNNSYGDDWPQWLGPKRDGVWRESGLLREIPAAGPKVLWRIPVGGGYAGPAVAQGKVFVPHRVLQSGATNPDNPFQKKNISGEERILCLDEKTGKTIWEHAYPCKYEISYPCGPRTTPLIDGDRVVCLGAMGDLVCLDIATGKPFWTVSFPKTFQSPIPTWGFACHPLKFKDWYIFLAGGKGSVVVALDRLTGKEVWRSLELENPANEIGYCPPMLFTFQGQEQLIVWHPEAVNGLNPETGKPLWRVPFKIKANLAISTPRQSGNRLFFTSFYNGSLFIEVQPGSAEPAKVIWKGTGRGEQPQQTKDLHAIMCNPWIDGDRVYGVCSYGELRCIELQSGKRLWVDLKATSEQGKTPDKPTERWANAFIIPLEDRYLLFNEKGDLIVAKLEPAGYKELSRHKILEPTGQSMQGARKVVWSHPAFAGRSIFMRNDKEIVKLDFSQAQDQ